MGRIPKKLKITYDFTPSKKDQLSTAIKITSGKWKDVIFTIGKTALAKEENPDGTLNAYFDYDIEFSPEGLKIDDKFSEIVGDILFNILEAEIKNEGKINLRSKEDFETKKDQKENYE